MFPRAIAASLLFGLAASRLAIPVSGQSAPPKPSARPSSIKTTVGASKTDSGPTYAYPATGTSAAARALAENIRRGEAGEPFLHLVDRQRGY